MQIYRPNQVSLTVTQDLDKEIIEEGRKFVSSYLFSDMADTSNYLALRFRSPNQDVHLSDVKTSVESGSLYISLLENVTLNSNGVSVYSSNFNRKSNTESNLNIFVNPNVASYGNTIYSTSILSTGNKTSSLTDNLQHFILDPTKDYLINVTHVGTSSDVWVSLIWSNDD
jgi:hypothetical protein